MCVCIYCIPYSTFGVNERCVSVTVIDVHETQMIYRSFIAVSVTACQSSSHGCECALLLCACVWFCALNVNFYDNVCDYSDGLTYVFIGNSIL